MKFEALKCHFSIRDEKNVNVVHVHQFKFTGAEVYSLLKGLAFIWRKLKHAVLLGSLESHFCIICNGSGVIS